MVSPAVKEPDGTVIVMVVEEGFVITEACPEIKTTVRPVRKEKV